MDPLRASVASDEPSRDTRPSGVLNESPPKRRKPNSRDKDSLTAGISGLPFSTPASQHQSAGQPYGNELETNLTTLAGFENAAMLPLLEYTGPDFGFDNPQPANFEEGEYLRLPVSDNLYASQSGTFGNMPWDAMMYGMMGNTSERGAWAAPGS